MRITSVVWSRVVVCLYGVALSACAGNARHDASLVINLDDDTTWTPVNAEWRRAVEGTTHALELAPVGGNRKGSNVGMAVLRGVTFERGSIDVDLHGARDAGASFVGLAFGMSSPTTYEAIYFRPFRFRSDDPVERSHAVQYVAWPEHTWEALRTASPGRYEAAITPVPDPAAWFHVHVEIGADVVKVFVDGATEPTLVVGRLRHDRGAIALWVDSQPASFANLRVNPS